MNLTKNGGGRVRVKEILREGKEVKISMQTNFGIFKMAAIWPRMSLFVAVLWFSQISFFAHIDAQ